ncbi:pancreatic triacylglycerol lipase-like [Lingula anatina]|uniref:Pancreatic triacylglycerol lipase-like n=1 Tax=Lingula anatina TaxID=7574 RepID=A0A1S3JVZ9_LINAN|nr:pancreatic triacylglycerol lipase-like [Lingula anatina]|eukprot:XP_013414568.1 pancreatic triacylglycerol lipase-like [Lingula anatina]
MARVLMVVILCLQSLWYLHAREVTDPEVVEIVNNRQRRADDESVCYPRVGCFNNSAPFNNAYNELPSDPDEVGTGFFLYTRNNPDVPENISNSDRGASLKSSSFNKDLPVKFITHGFTDSRNASWMKLMVDAFLKVGPMNVVLVDWENGAKAPNYPKATANTRLVGREIGLMVKLMVSKMKSKHSLIHLLGHSLGAHISGYAGAYLGGKIARITGLDPAGPFFESYPPIVRLDKSDAKFVDVIHSNGASITSGGAGLRLPVGDVDFYPNGGGYQPGCGNPIRGSLAQLFNGNFQGAGTTIACSHKRAILVFVDSMVSDCLFTSYPCADWDAFNRGECLDCSWSTGGCSQMGYYADKYKVTGNLYLKTISSSPYCGFNYAVEVTLSNSTKGQVKIRLVGEHGLSDVLELTGQVILLLWSLYIFFTFLVVLI